MKIAIVGGGVEGASNYRYFSSLPNAAVTVHDQNTLKQSDFPEARLITGLAYLDNLDEYDLVVHSPGIRPDKLGVQPDKVTTSTKEFFDKCQVPIIGVTGTKGKGTTSTLIAKFLEADGKKVHLLGNIGAPPLDELPKINSSDWVVFELSSFQLIDMHKSPHIAVHLMFEPDHLDYHTDMEEYASAKANIFRFQKPGDIAVYYSDSELAKRAVSLSKATTRIPYDRNGTFSDGAYIKDGYIMFGSKKIAKTSDVALVGEHMLDNVCAAVATTNGLVDDKTVYAKVLRSFTGLPHRLQVIATKHGVTYVDDSISTIPGTAIAAISAFSQPKIIILGGSDKGNDFADLAEVICKNNVKKVILLGQMATKIENSLKSVGYNEFEKTHSMREAVNMAARVAKSGDVVLLSPACASFDMFTGYTERGDNFTQAVKELK